MSYVFVFHKNEYKNITLLSLVFVFYKFV